LAFISMGVTPAGPWVVAQDGPANLTVKPVEEDIAHQALRPSSGQYMGQRWHIDQRQRLWWNGSPYVRFAFTGNGDPVQMQKAGFDQFGLMPPEKWPISGPDPKIIQSVKETSEQLDALGATYYGGLNALWPWRYGTLIGDADRVAVFVRHVRDLSDKAGRRTALDFDVSMPTDDVDRQQTRPVLLQAVLFDLEHGTQLDVTGYVESFGPAGTRARSETDRVENDDADGGLAYRFRCRPIELPRSSSLRLVLAMELRMAEVRDAHGLPPLWKPGIRQFYQRSLEAFRAAYARPGLRGLYFADEINGYPSSLLTARVYLDLRDDASALTAYRKWLARRYGSIDRLNRDWNSRHASFDEVPWQVPMHPFLPGLARTDAAAEREETWAGATTTWGLADSVEQLRKVSQVQQEFRQWFYGHWLAEYAKLAQEVFGPVPTFVCSAAIMGDADQYLAIHRWALREGMDGLIRNHYGHGGAEERETLASLARWMARVQAESGCTKHLWANEVGYVRPGITDDEWAAQESAELAAADSFGSQWAFPSQESLRDMLVLLTQYGYRGLNRFLMNPSSPRAAREVQWMNELRGEIIPRVVK
jgi:hypothetical protein